jgi:filamentous hemagglutinin family protein
MDYNNKLRLAVIAAVYSGSAAAGDVTFDGTVGLAGAAPFDAAVKTFTVGENRGTLAGTNLFHSFSTFIVDAAETARFTATTPGITNVISRVTGIGSSNGLQPTTIDGTVRSEIPNANFWFINPAGITVGPAGVIDVPGALALGAADFVEFGSKRWYALGNQGDAASALTVDPLDFGFLDNSAAGRLTWNRTGDFTLAPEGDLILANADLRTNGDLRIEGDSVVLSGSNLRTDAISADAGDITVFARESSISL